jgi:hypothetical protein
VIAAETVGLSSYFSTPRHTQVLPWLLKKWTKEGGGGEENARAAGLASLPNGGRVNDGDDAGRVGCGSSSIYVMSAAMIEMISVRHRVHTSAPQ